MGEHKRVAIITDTHFGIRKGSQIFHDYFEKFYEQTFFPTLDKYGIDTIIHLGDVFDVRKNIDYWSLEWAKRVFFDPLRDRGIKAYIVVGNHDIFYKTSLKLNSPSLNLSEYDNIVTIDSPQDIVIKDTSVFMIPWLCEDNASSFTENLGGSRSRIAMGHLELTGFYANQNYQCNHGTNPEILRQFDTVFSGHFHKKSTRSNITYLGNPYQLYWNDEGDIRGFHLFDLESQELEFIENPTKMFHKIYYDESKSQLINPHKTKESYVKIIVEGKSTPKKLARLVDTLYEVGIHDLKVLETLDTQVGDDVEVEAEDTLTTLTNYVNAMEESVNKQNVIEIFKSLYVEAQEV